MLCFSLSRRVSALALTCALASAAQINGAVAQTVLPDVEVSAARETPAAQPGPSVPAASGPAQNLPGQNLTVGGVGGAPLPKSAVPDNVPATVATVTPEQIQEQVNAMDVMEAIKYLPSVEVRERYLGDRNGILATRTTGTVSGAESLVYADDLLLSNLLGNSYSYPPRWDMVSLPEIQRIDMIYGPFSALYPGNSMGGVLTMTARMPDHFEYHFAARGSLEDFSLYGTQQRNPGGDLSIAMGDRIGDFAWWVSWDHLDAFGHPMSFDTADIDTGVKGKTGPTVTGTYQDSDPTTGQQRYVFGAYSIDHSNQDLGKIKLSYNITPSVTATYTVGLWGLQSDTSTQTYLTNTATGAPVTNTSSGYVNVNGLSYKLSGLDPSVANAVHLMQGVSIKSDTHGLFDFDAGFSSYDYLMDHSLAAQNYGVSTAGLNTQMGGTGWRTADLRGIFRPDTDLLGKHEISFGGHWDSYFLEQNVYNTGSSATTNSTGWDTQTNGTLNNASGGRTQTEALYLQDVWSFTPKWKLTLGGREEFWQAMNGYIIPAPKAVALPGDEALSSFSPKAALTWQARNDLLLRASFGEAYRYPTVTELYQSVSNSSSVVIPDPDLKPERVLSYDLSAEYAFARNTLLRLTLFREDRSNAIFSQVNASVTPNVTETLNIGQMYVNGVEMALGTRNWMVDGLDVDGSVTYADSQITADPTNAAIVGNAWPRIPRWRAHIALTYHPTEKWALSAGFRYSSGANSTIANTDVIENDYGAISEYMVLDMKASYKINKQMTASLGVDNMTDCKYFVSPHPYPQFTGFAEIRYDY